MTSAQTPRWKVSRGEGSGLDGAEVMSAVGDMPCMTCRAGEHLQPAVAGSRRGTEVSVQCQQKSQVSGAAEL